MYTCSCIVHMSSFMIALLVMHRRTSFFFGVLLTADSQDFSLSCLFVLAFMPRVPMCKQKIIWNLETKTSKWMIDMRMLANLFALIQNSCVALPFRQQHEGVQLCHLSTKENPVVDRDASGHTPGRSILVS